MKRIQLYFLLLLPLLYLKSEIVYSQTPELVLPIGHSDSIVDIRFIPAGNWKIW
jgi:hypothetical protein